MKTNGGVLITGFDRFGNYANNPSQLLVESFGGSEECDTVILPTSYAQSITKVIPVIRANTYRAILMFGLANRPPGFYLETVAKRVSASGSPDNDGAVPVGSKELDGPPTLKSTLPLDDMQEALHREGLPVSLSHDAGDYVCNSLMYQVLLHLRVEESTAVAGFIHISPLANTVGDRVEQSTGGIGAFLTLEQMIVGARACLMAVG